MCSAVFECLDKMIVSEVHQEPLEPDDIIVPIGLPLVVLEAATVKATRKLKVLESYLLFNKGHFSFSLFNLLWTLIVQVNFIEHFFQQNISNTTYASTDVEGSFSAGKLV